MNGNIFMDCGAGAEDVPGEDISGRQDGQTPLSGGIIADGR